MDYLAETMGRAGRSSRSVGMEAGIGSVNTVRQWQSYGSVPSLASMAKVAAAADRPVSALVAAYFGEEEPPTIPAEDRVRGIFREECQAIAEAAVRAIIGGGARGDAALDRLRVELGAAERALDAMAEAAAGGRSGGPRPARRPPPRRR